MNWYIGQKIVAVKNHSQGFFKEGDVFSVIGLRQGCCNVEIDVGIKHTMNTFRCKKCNTVTKSDGKGWFCESCFAPLDEMQAHESAIKELLKENEIHETIH